MMSNPRKPAAIRRAEGNRGHRPIPDEVAGLGKPEPPPHLTAEQLARWHDIVESLPGELLSRADNQVLERMSIAWAAFRETSVAINESGLLTLGQNGEQVRNPLLSVRRQATQEMHQCGLSLGLSPYARTRLATQQTEEDDLLSALMARPIRPSHNN
ncbi:phage terminase small subunit P27 family [Nordella sp. HKS 07]|uniref:phage terminase small subunit P27 family n=1 Tax=Nordella sp. HKS 07 TaxID=2712222 RepID=UPI0013E19CAC|nr:phage terminase small subunit P27 family [Nordella sp. HKS 07]QIG46636.1 phage terminase small subunit P27 family [Nordella sp. HKS 07]